jgi:hypothetical protein
VGLIATESRGFRLKPNERFAFGDLQPSSGLTPLKTLHEDSVGTTSISKTEGMLESDRLKGGGFRPGD